MEPTPGRPKIGRAIRRAMERKRMSQGDLAAALGVSRSAVNAWINDRAYPQNSLGALEEILGVKLDDDGSPTLAVVPHLDDDADPDLAEGLRRLLDEAERRKAIRRAAPGAYRRVVAERENGSDGG